MLRNADGGGGCQIFRKKANFGNFEVGIYFRNRHAHCCPLRVATGSGGGALDVSGHDHFGTCHFVNFSFKEVREISGMIIYIHCSRNAVRS